jgi:hypothetical protein
MKRTVVWLLFFSGTALACTVAPNVRKVPRSFRVHINNDFGPVAGLKLQVSFFNVDKFKTLTDEQQRSVEPNKFEEIVAEAITDQTGTAHFNLDRNGTFDLLSSAGFLDWVQLEVSDQPTSPPLELQWPSVAILGAAHLRGRLSKGLFSSRSTPLKNQELKLHTPIDYREVANSTTDDNGAFDFKGIAPGLYFLQIVKKGEKNNDFYNAEGDIAVYLSPDNPRDRLMISTDNTSCGLSYDLDENKAHYKPEACFKGGKQVECDY